MSGPSMPARRPAGPADAGDRPAGELHPGAERGDVGLVAAPPADHEPLELVARVEPDEVGGVRAEPSRKFLADDVEEHLGPDAVATATATRLRAACSSARLESCSRASAFASATATRPANWPRRSSASSPNVWSPMTETTTAPQSLPSTLIGAATSDVTPSSFKSATSAGGLSGRRRSRATAALWRGRASAPHR